jgi:Fur family transcriptional regulator, ferric uptake regulator
LTLEERAIKIIQMNAGSDLTEKLKSLDHRITPIRRHMFKFFSDNPSPVSAIDILDNFSSLGIDVNKTTVYREIEFLVKSGIIQEVEFGEGKKRYEVDTGRHHHHVICLNCKTIADVELEVDLHKEEKLIEAKTGFKVKNHSLEFFGLCPNCLK